MTDALSNPWIYTYNALGNLTRVDAPGGVVRTWTYDASNRLISEFHPESGTVTYAYFPGTALLQTKTDAKGTVFSYSYDDNGRLTQVTGAGRTTSITYESGSDNRQSMSVTGGASTTFTYETTTGRLSQRSDVVNGPTFTRGLDPISWTLSEKWIRRPRWRQPPEAGTRAGASRVSSSNGIARTRSRSANPL